MNAPSSTTKRFLKIDRISLVEDYFSWGEDESQWFVQMKIENGSDYYFKGSEPWAPADEEAERFLTAKMIAEDVTRILNGQKQTLELCCCDPEEEEEEDGGDAKPL